MKFLLDEGGDLGINANRAMVNELQYNIRRIRGDRVLEARLPSAMLGETKSMMDDILAL
jgi:hypothetical protein